MRPTEQNMIFQFFKTKFALFETLTFGGFIIWNLASTIGMFLEGKGEFLFRLLTYGFIVVTHIWNFEILVSHILPSTSTLPEFLFKNILYTNLHSSVSVSLLMLVFCLYKKLPADKHECSQCAKH